MEGARRIETWARLGFAARGIVYILLGWIALSTGRALSASETVEEVAKLPLGPGLIIALSLGLFGYGLYSLHSALIDGEGDGDHARGRLVRLGRALAGMVYWGLAWLALSQLWSGRSGAGDVERSAAQEVAHSTGGSALLIVAGAFAFGVAFAQFANVFNSRFMRGMSGCPAFVRPTGCAGFIARGLIIAMVGWFLLRAGLEGEQFRSSADALAIMRRADPLLFKLTAAGLAAFGVMSLMMARYRTIPDDDVVDTVVEKVRA